MEMGTNLNTECLFLVFQALQAQALEDNVVTSLDMI